MGQHKSEHEVVFSNRQDLIFVVSVGRFLGFSEIKLSLLLHTALIAMVRQLSVGSKNQNIFLNLACYPGRVCFTKLIIFGPVS